MFQAGNERKNNDDGIPLAFAFSNSAFFPLFIGKVVVIYFNGNALCFLEVGIILEYCSIALCTNPLRPSGNYMNHLL
jgi:hypothetical protein